VCAGQLVFENWAHKPIVEEACGPIDDVQRFGVGVVCPDATRGAEHRAVWERGTAGLARLGLRPAAQKVANRHSIKPISRIRHAFSWVLTGWVVRAFFES
jgi:hypothetical protein